ncbi:MAG TPA: discoidin domain-containing protein, partial [Polyangiaceae bacterium]|nr:discoidin domain-containing protein [Polyangiaceae bacterium]
ARLGLERVRWQRAVRTAVVVVLAALAVDGAVRLRPLVVRGPDLAAGKAWHPSSSVGPCAPAKHACAGAVTDILFHTEEEDSPWLEIDLGARQAFGRVDVTNRSDCCGERALPLVLEASDDGVAWRAVARRDEPFRKWKVVFDRQWARYVRLRVERRSILHLDGVSIYR